MVLKFNPPPDWPAPPPGWEPPPGWQPDPCWPPLPDSWDLWVDDIEPPTVFGGPNELITLENLSQEHLHGVLANAYIDTFVEDGDLGIREGCTMWVFPESEYRRIKLVAIYEFFDHIDQVARLEFANNVNSTYIMVQASVLGDRAWFSYCIPLDAPITRRYFVSIVKRFSQIVPSPVNEFSEGIIS